MSATLYTVFAPTKLAYERYTQKVPTELVAWQIYIFVIAIFWTKLYPVLPKPGIRKWRQEEASRASHVYVAASRLTSALAAKNLLQTDLQAVCQGILSAMKSEVEALMGDKEGLYFNVSLLLEEHDDGNRVYVFTRVDQNRQNSSYLKKDLLIAPSFSTGKCIYIPECHLTDRPYKCIFGYPLFSQLSSGMTFLGAVTIDSSEPRHFDGLELSIETKLLPYISLLKLAIIADRTIGEKRRRNGRQRNN